MHANRQADTYVYKAANININISICYKVKFKRKIFLKMTKINEK